MCTDCGWEDFLADIEDLQCLMEENDCTFAEDTVAGIEDWVREQEHCTERQKEAITNIRRHVER